MSTSLLEVQALQVHFMSRSSIVRAVDGVDFSVAQGETLCIVGESGSGKTITSLALLRLVPPPERSSKAASASRAPTCCIFRTCRWRGFAGAAWR